MANSTIKKELDNCFAIRLAPNQSITLNLLSSSFFILIQPNAGTRALINIGSDGTYTEMIGTLDGLSISVPPSGGVTLTSTISWYQVLVVLGANRVG